MLTRRSFVALAPIAVRAADTRKLHAGAATANITPALGASLAGGMQDNIARDVHDELHVKAVVLDNGSGRLVIATIDSCAVPRVILDAAKQRIAERAGIPTTRVCLSATHTHSAPAATHLFQSLPDPIYTSFLTERIANCVQLAIRRLEPAQVGFGIGKEPRLLFNRRFFMKPGTVLRNPFGAEDKVKMNPGQGNPDIVKPAGPIDPDVGLIAVHSLDGRPLALIGNYALHYVGGVGGGVISADYFPVWGATTLRLAGMNPGAAVTMMTNACSGNINNVDVTSPNVGFPPFRKIEQVCDILAAETLRVWKEIKFEKWVPLEASEEELEIAVRLPSKEEAEAARKRLGHNPPPTQKAVEDVYARETVLLARDYPETVKVWIQGLRIGSLGIGTYPGEAFTEMGLELKRKSPFPGKTLLIELANGYHGYIPTEEGHAQGGYETWRAKSSFLAADAAPKMVAAAARRLQSIAG